MKILEVTGLTATLNGNPFLQNIHCSLHAGEILAVLGPNGAGKSTLLKAIAGSLPYQQGQVTILNKPLETWAVRDLAKYRAVLSQNWYFPFPMTVLQVVLLGRYPHCGQEAVQPAIMDVAYELLEALGVKQYVEQDIRQLSGGEQQRVQLARVLLQIWTDKPQPRLLLLDEPTASLDIVYQHQLLQYLTTEFIPKQLGILWIVHDMNLALQYAHSGLLLKKGTTVASGRIENVLNATNLRTTFEVEAHFYQHPILQCLQVSTYTSNIQTNKQMKNSIS